MRFKIFAFISIFIFLTGNAFSQSLIEDVSFHKNTFHDYFGLTLSPGSIEIGSSKFNIGILDNLQLGTNFIDDILGCFNIGLKWNIISYSHFSLTTQIDLFYVSNIFFQTVKITEEGFIDTSEFGYPNIFLSAYFYLNNNSAINIDIFYQYSHITQFYIVYENVNLDATAQEYESFLKIIPKLNSVGFIFDYIFIIKYTDFINQVISTKLVYDYLIDIKSHLFTLNITTDISFNNFFSINFMAAYSTNPFGYIIFSNGLFDFYIPEYSFTRAFYFNNFNFGFGFEFYFGSPATN